MRQFGGMPQTFYRCYKLYGGMQRYRLTRLKELEKESQRPRRAAPPDLTLDKLILTEAALGNFSDLHLAASASPMCGPGLA